jgi:hypothetical protein
MWRQWEQKQGVQRGGEKERLGDKNRGKETRNEKNSPKQPGGKAEQTMPPGVDKNNLRGPDWWFTPVIPATQEVEIWSIAV